MYTLDAIVLDCIYVYVIRCGAASADSPGLSNGGVEVELGSRLTGCVADLVSRTPSIVESTLATNSVQSSFLSVGGTVVLHLHPTLLSYPHEAQPEASCCKI